MADTINNKDGLMLLLLSSNQLFDSLNGTTADWYHLYLFGPINRALKTKHSPTVTASAQTLITSLMEAASVSAIRFLLAVYAVVPTTFCLINDSYCCKNNLIIKNNYCICQNNLVLINDYCGCSNNLLLNGSFCICKNTLIQSKNNCKSFIN